MFKWFREILEIRYEFKERKLRLTEQAEQERNICPSCEILKQSLDRANFEKEQLLRRILNPPTIENIIHPAPEITKPVSGRHLPWVARRQALEQEDRKQAEILKNFNQEKAKIEAASSSDKTATEQNEIDKLERNLGITQ